MKNILCIIIFLGLVMNGKGQDPQFSQFYASPLYLGPSMAGTGDFPRLILNYRDQWPKLAGRFITYSLSYDQFIPKYKSGVGVLILHDNAGKGKLTTTQVGLNYSYRITLTRDFMIQPGLQFQYYQRQINFNGLTFADQYFGDMVLPTSIENAPDDRAGHIDFSTSLLAFSKEFWFGSNIDHLMKLNPSLVDNDRYVPLKFSVFGGYKFILKESLLNKLEQSVTAAFHYKNQAMMQQLDLGIYYSQLPFMVGIWYRGIPVIKSIHSSDAITLSCGARFQQFSLTYSYDLTISSLITSTGGAHELGMTYNFENWSNNRRRRMATVPCPKF